MDGANSAQETQESQALDFEHFVNRQANNGELTITDSKSDIQIVFGPHTDATVERSTGQENQLSEIAAAHAAVVLAKAQASAAYQESKQARRDFLKSTDELTGAKSEKQHLQAELTTARDQFIAIDKELAVEQARMVELRKRADSEHMERLKLTKRLEQLTPARRPRFSFLRRQTA